MIELLLLLAGVLLVADTAALLRLSRYLRDRKRVEHAASDDLAAARYTPSNEQKDVAPDQSPVTAQL